MDFLNSRTFEIFRYIIPSSVAVAFSLWLFEYDKNLSLLKANFANIDILLGLFLLIVLYVVGVFIDELVYRIFRIVKNFRKKKGNSYISKNSMSISEKYSILRIKSKENFTYVEYWNALKGMCRNLAIVGVYVVICSIGNLVMSGFMIEIVIIIIFTSFFSYLMVLRANLYSDFANSELDSSIDTLEK